MVAVKIEDLKQRTDEIVRRLREAGEPVQLLEEEHVVAKRVPATGRTKPPSWRRIRRRRPKQNSRSSGQSSMN